MYRSTGFKQPKHSHFRSTQQYDRIQIPTSIPPPLLNPQFNTFDIKDSTLKLSIQKLLNQNVALSQNLQKERQKNYDLLEIKRKMQDDLKKMQFQIQRLGIHGNLSNRQSELKNRQVLEDNIKIKRQLDAYFVDIKNLQTQVRKNLNQIQQLMKQKQDMVKQNVTLLSHVTDLKQKLHQKQNHNIELENYVQELLETIQKNNGQNAKRQRRQGEQGQRDTKQTSIHDLVTIRSLEERAQQKNSNSNSSQNIKLYQSPENERYAAGKAIGKNQRQQLSTNPSQNKIAFTSGYSSPYINLGQFQKIQQQAQPSPRSFTNKQISKKLQLYSSPINPLYSQDIQISPQMQSPSVISYAHTNTNTNLKNGSPLFENLRINTESRSQYQSYEQGTQGDAVFLRTYQKKEVNEQVAGLRDDLVDELIRKYYMGAIEVAQKQKKNSLKLFITFVTPKISTLSQMSQNYLQARMMLSETCPTIRLKYEPHNPFTSSLYSSPQNLPPKQKNTEQVYKIYESIKTNAKKQKNINGQYLALFRYLTLLYKLDENVEALLVQSIKHSVAKQIQKIKQFCNGNMEFQTNGQQEDDQ